MRRLLVEAASSTVTYLVRVFDGVLGFDRRSEGGDTPSSLAPSPSSLLERDDGVLVAAPLTLPIYPPLPSLRFSSSAAFCRSVFLRSGLRGVLLASCGDLSRSTSAGGRGSVVSGGLGGATPVLTGTSCAACFSLLLSRSVGSGV